MAMTEDKKSLIRKRLVQGISIRDIAQEAGVSARTVQRIKAKTPVTTLKEHDTGDNSIRFDSTTFLTKKEEEYTKRLQGALCLYEDDEEGWIYHLHKDDNKRKSSGLWWSFIAYPESAPERWIERLRATGCEVAISPLHDKDKWSHDSPEAVDPETGEIIPRGARYRFGDRKKSHWHGIVKFEQRTSFTDANDLIRRITQGPYIQRCRSLKNSYEYFVHLNTPEKYQGYDKGEILVLNGFHLEPNKFELTLLQDEILGVIRDKNMIHFYELTDYYRGQPEYIMIIANKPGIFSSLIKSLWLKENPNRVTTVRIIDDKGDNING